MASRSKTTDPVLREKRINAAVKANQTRKAQKAGQEKQEGAGSPSLQQLVEYAEREFAYHIDNYMEARKEIKSDVTPGELAKWAAEAAHEQVGAEMLGELQGVRLDRDFVSQVKVDVLDFFKAHEGYRPSADSLSDSHSATWRMKAVPRAKFLSILNEMIHDGTLRHPVNIYCGSHRLYEMSR